MGHPAVLEESSVSPLLEYDYGQKNKAYLAFTLKEELSHPVVWDMGALKRKGLIVLKFGRVSAGLGKEESMRF